MKFNDELALFLKARYPILYINTIEEDRLEYVIRRHIKVNFNRSIYSWDFIDGYTNNPNNEGFANTFEVTHAIPLLLYYLWRLYPSFWSFNIFGTGRKEVNSCITVV